jgi:hypothetical protein
VRFAWACCGGNACGWTEPVVSSWQRRRSARRGWRPRQSWRRLPFLNLPPCTWSFTCMLLFFFCFFVWSCFSTTYQQIFSRSSRKLLIFILYSTLNLLKLNIFKEGLPDLSSFNVKWISWKWWCIIAHGYCTHST